MGVGFPVATTPSKPKMDDPASKSLRDRLDALLRRAREISADIEKRVEEVTAEPATSGPPDARKVEPAAVTSPGAEKSANSEVAQEAIEVAAEAVAVSAEAAAVTAEALSTIASESGAAPEIPPSPPDAPTTVVPEAAAAVANDAGGAPPAGAAATTKDPTGAAVSASTPPAPETKSDPDTENEA
jgi:hypothetical protein